MSATPPDSAQHHQSSRSVVDLLPASDGIAWSVPARIPTVMSMKRVARVFVLLLIVTLCQCSHCVDETLTAIQSPGRAFKAELELRRCGSVEGWSVSLSGQRLPKRQVFMARMPPPTSVEDIRNGVSIQWEGPSTLVIKAPAWVRLMAAEKQYGSISLKYELNPIAYPSP